MNKFIQLFEDFKKDIKAQNTDTQHTWTDVRDAIQMKRPFVIIIFRTKSSYLTALKGYLSQFDYVKQTAIKIHNGNEIKYPSVFFVLDKETDFRAKIKEIYEKFDIKQIIIGETNEDYANSYSEDGTAAPVGNELVSGLNQDEFKTEDHFKIGSMYYRFLSFEN